ncbi:MAG: sodium:dicarboxylate symporter [Planctomycetes bacterium RBG_16_43_13]|nr:MAG: sodium:dicarboxylate symporter [Planctomycetes bacterium RBG_16_43_13]
MSKKKHLSLATKILMGLAFGAIYGVATNIMFSHHPTLEWIVANITYPIGQIFLRLIFMVVIPLIFSALALGVAELGDLRRLGRIGFKTLFYTIIVTSISVLIGLTLVNLVEPGKGLSDEARTNLTKTISNTATQQNIQRAQESKSVVQTILDIIPRNPLADAVGSMDEGYRGGGLLAVMFFSLIVGIALARSDPAKTQTFLHFLQGLYEITMKIIGFAMAIAPYGVFALIFSITARLGFEVVAILGKYVLVVIAGLLIHQFGVYSLLVKTLAKMSPITFFKAIREVMLTAFSTSSSNATLPTSIKVTEENLGVPKEISRFVLTLGSTANQNGTALYEGVTVLFLAQFFGIELSLGSQITVLLMAILAGIGTAGVPGGSLPFIVLILTSVGIPGEGIGVILGVDRLLDMCRTVLNVTGDITAAAYIARSEGYNIGQKT